MEGTRLHGRWASDEDDTERSSDAARAFVFLLGYWFWGDIPDALASTGIGLVLAAGLYTLHRERTGLIGKRAPTPQRSPAE